MRVALDVSAVPREIAGAGRYIAELAARLPSRDVDTTLVTRAGDAARWHERSPSATIANLVPNGRATRLVFEAWSLGKSRTARSVDVWHSPHYSMPHRGSTPTVVTIHDLTFFTNPEWHERSKVAFFRRAIEYAASHARVLVCVSDFSARLLEEILPSHAPIVVAPLGVDLEEFQPVGTGDAQVLEANGLPPDSSFILFVGTIEPRKGLDVLLQAFDVTARRDNEIELWLAGQLGWLAGPVEAELAQHPNRGRIRRLGYVDEALLPVLYRRARAVAYPSRGEGFGLPVLEAMACGAQVVTSEATVMADVAGDGARLVPAGDPEALAAALLEMLAAGEGVRASWSRRARSRATRFTWDACLDRHLVAYGQARKG